MSDKRVVLISGANKGIGFETARQLGQAGHTVIVGSRDAKRGEEAQQKLAAEGIDAHALELDVNSTESIDKAVKWVEERFGHLDTLVNNAGVWLEGWGAPPTQTTPEVWRKTFDTNVFAVVAVTNAFLPLVRKSAAGRIVNVSSILGSLALHSDPKSDIYNIKVVAYNSSKAALNQYTVHLAHELRDTPIKVNAGHPGWVKTDLGGPNAPMELADGAKTNVWLATLPADGPTGGYFHQQQTLPW